MKSITVALAAALLVTLVACRPDPTGKPCTADEECGRGFDCYRNLCQRVCTTLKDCPAGQSCFRYHCLEPRSTPGAQPAPEVGRGRATPPPPDPTVAELRAIRRELELLRRDIARLHGQEDPPSRSPDSSGSGRDRPKIQLPPSSAAKDR